MTDFLFHKLLEFSINGRFFRNPDLGNKPPDNRENHTHRHLNFQVSEILLLHIVNILKNSYPILINRLENSSTVHQNDIIRHNDILVILLSNGFQVIVQETFKFAYSPHDRSLDRLEFLLILPLKELFNEFYLPFLVNLGPR